jgi:hypothetical protein
MDRIDNHRPHWDRNLKMLQLRSSSSSMDRQSCTWSQRSQMIYRYERAQVKSKHVDASTYWTLPNTSDTDAYIVARK